jgi:hypothetical protein
MPVDLAAHRIAAECGAMKGQELLRRYQSFDSFISPEWLREPTKGTRQRLALCLRFLNQKRLPG